MEWRIGRAERASPDAPLARQSPAAATAGLFPGIDDDEERARELGWTGLDFGHHRGGRNVPAFSPLGATRLGANSSPPTPQHKALRGLLCHPSPERLDGSLHDDEALLCESFHFAGRRGAERNQLPLLEVNLCSPQREHLARIWCVTFTVAVAKLGVHVCSQRIDAKAYREK